MFKMHKLASMAVLVSLLSLAFTTPVYAYEGRGGDRVVVAATEVVNDDLYVGAGEFILDGTVNGDVIAAGQTITINGTISGNLIAAGNTIVVNGTVGGDVLAAGAVLHWGEASTVGGDVIAAGGSLELRKGSTVGRDAMLAGGQVLLTGDVGRNVEAGAGALEIAGTVGGDVTVEVGEAGEGQAGPPMGMFMGQSTVAVPVIPPGLTIDPEAKIAGDLDYTQNAELAFPAGVVAGRVTRMRQPVEEGKPEREPTLGEKAGSWALKSARSLVTLILLGLFLLWVLPRFMQALSEYMRAKPWRSLGWGAVAYAGFFFLVLLTLFIMILGAVVFGLLTLGGLSASMVWTGLLALFALILGFVLVTSFLAKIVFGMTLGKWILSSAKSPLAEHRFWPMVIGVAIMVVVLAVLTFPSIPGALGGLLNFAIILFGLGTLWLWIWQALKKEAPATS
jgi:cytoskeletal protein CcmA (bactofilin family)